MADQRRTPAGGIPTHETPEDAFGDLRADVRALAEKQSQDRRQLHGRMGELDRDVKKVSRDVAELQVTCAATEAKLDTLVEFAREDRAERAQERSLSLQRRASTETQLAKTETERVKLDRAKVNRTTKVAVALVSSGVIGLLLGKLLS